MPYIASQHSATSKIGKYLNRLLRPFVERVTKPKTFHNEFDFIEKLHYYTYMKDRLRPTTLFCTIRIKNFYSMVSHKTMIDEVNGFFQDYLPNNKLEKVSIMTIKYILRLFLDNNIFSYKEKVYTVNKGGPNTMPLLDTLSNIYLFGWEKMIVREVERNSELFGR